jgi:hypothetical protein
MLISYARQGNEFREPMQSRGNAPRANNYLIRMNVVRSSKAACRLPHAACLIVALIVGRRKVP